MRESQILVFRKIEVVGIGEISEGVWGVLDLELGIVG